MLKTFPENNFKGYNGFINSLSNKEGWKIVNIKPNCDLEIEFNSNKNMWDDGVPVTKYFYRNKNYINLNLVKDETYKMVKYEKIIDGDIYNEDNILEYYLYNNGYWFMASETDAEMLEIHETI